LLTPGEIYVSLKDVTQSADLLGAVARLPARVPLGRLTQDTVKLVFKAEDAPRTYLYWLLQTPQYREYCRAHSTGTTNLGLARDDFLNFEVPPLTPERQWIVDLVQSIEDKIELNRRMNETLEGMAQAIFRDWFVDFGPVRRALAGEADPVAIMGGLTPDPTRAAQLAALFPAAFGNDGLPVGWTEKTLGDWVEPRKGRNITKKTITPGNVPVVAGGLEPAYYHDTPNVTGPVITASASGANAGFVRLYSQDIWASDCSFISREQTDHLFTTYTLLASRQDEIYKMQQGAAQPHIYPSDLKRLVISDAPEQVWDACEELLTPMFERVAHNDRENRTLAETRDYLLPRLMSGAVRVTPQAEAA
jgi:type I restriction enzyme S subunit